MHAEKTTLAHVSHYVRWNAFEAICAQGILLGTTLFIRTNTNASIHGSWAALIGAFYLTISILDMGFSTSLAPFFPSLNHLKKSIYSHAILVISGSICASLILNLLFFQENKLGFFVLIIIALIAESAHKSIRRYLQLSGLVKLTALTEISGVAAFFLTTLWLSYTTELSVMLLLMILTLSITLQTFFLSLYAYYIRKQKNKASIPQTSNLNRRFTKSRLYIGTHDITRQLFSTNFLLPFFALTAGTPHASTVKIAASIIMWITIIIEKSIGTTSLITFAHNKNETKSISKIMQKSWTYVVIACAICLSFPLYSALYKTNTTSMRFLVLALIGLAFLESFITIYTKRFIIEEKAYIPLIFSVISCASFGLVLIPLSSSILYNMIGFRFIILCCLIYSAYITEKTL